MLDGIEDVSTVTCVWCDERTTAGRPCQACGGDPAGPFAAPTGMSAVRERRAQARKAMLAARLTPPADREAPAGATGSGPVAVVAPPASAVMPAQAAPPRWDVPEEVEQIWPGTPPARSSVVPIVCAIVVPVVALVIIGAGFKVLGSKPPAPVRQPVAAPAGGTSGPASAGGTSGPASAGGTTAPTLPGGEGWPTFLGPNFKAVFPGGPVAVTESFPCGCPGPLALQVWHADEGTTSYYIGEMPLPPNVSGFPDDLVNATVNDMMDSDVTFTAAPLSHVGPYATRDVQVSSETWAGSARIMVGQGTMWMLVGQNDYGQPPDWAYFLKMFEPGGQPLPSPPTRSPAGSGFA